MKRDPLADENDRNRDQTRTIKFYWNKHTHTHRVKPVQRMKVSAADDISVPSSLDRHPKTKKPEGQGGRRGSRWLGRDEGGLPAGPRAGAVAREPRGGNVAQNTCTEAATVMGGPVGLGEHKRLNQGSKAASKL